MKISIVVPVYNGEKFLKECLDSLINQTHKNIEIVIVNDASTDNTKQIIQEYMSKDSRIIYIENKENMKLYETLCIAYENVTGDYITVCDADDLLHIEACTILLAKAIESNADIVTSIIWGQKLDNNIYPQSQEIDAVWTNTSNNPQAVLESYFINIKYKRNKTGGLIKREIVKKFLLYTFRNIKVNKFEDWISSPILYACSNKRIHIDSQIYEYRFNPDSETRRQNAKELVHYFREFSICYECNKSFFKTIKVWDMIKDRFIRDMELHLKGFVRISSSSVEELPLEVVSIINEFSDTLRSIFIKVYLEFSLENFCDDDCVSESVIMRNKWYDFGMMTRNHKIKHLIKYILRKLGLKFIYEK
ncbi:MAG: glycosyltransferase family 2 protein [Spirochaetota bacterium]|nr:glycosyltransferase family 2 protein [Spirochaetota bacterium]